MIESMLRPTERAHALYNRWIHGVPNRYERLAELVEEARPRTLLEVGVWRGDRSEVLVRRAARGSGAPVSFFGFDLFEEADATSIAKEQNKMPPSLDRVRRRLAPLEQEGHRVELVRGDTRRTLAEAVGRLPPIDFAFIDGGHTYDAVRTDWEHVQQLRAPGAVVVFDDFVNPAALRHADWGVNRLIGELDRSRWQVDVLEPSDWWAKPWGLLVNRLVRVLRRPVS